VVVVVVVVVGGGVRQEREREEARSTGVWRGLRDGGDARLKEAK